ncbi:hypothetical protein M378DRAFT_19431 [Amanita muscaria Koide BX008]|uniref:Uncharacterized protein n=1 Tax=Amanita muscaria (strain Koide BX008) TaxID=946122 RepID=A0A0C2RUH9_AMAMK|nr:hypothetical protein M378DRAFT_19431 [Amanita muscaria Koide BX008]
MLTFPLVAHSLHDTSHARSVNTHPTQPTLVTRPFHQPTTARPSRPPHHLRHTPLVTDASCPFGVHAHRCHIPDRCTACAYLTPAGDRFSAPFFVSSFLFV